MSETLTIPGEGIQTLAIEAGAWLRQVASRLQVPAPLAERLIEEVTGEVRRDLCAGLDRMRFHARRQG